jgi:hypothetical protein
LRYSSSAIRRIVEFQRILPVSTKISKKSPPDGGQRFPVKLRQGLARKRL